MTEESQPEDDMLAVLAGIIDDGICGVRELATDADTDMTTGEAIVSSVLFAIVISAILWLGWMIIGILL